MALLDDYIKDLAPLVNLDCGTCNTAGVTRAAEIMKGYFESIGFTCELIDPAPKRVGVFLQEISRMPTTTTSF